MRDRDRVRKPVRERAGRPVHGALEHPTAFGRQGFAVESVEHQQACVCGQTGEERRRHVCVGPLQQLRQVRPIGLIRQPGLHRLGAGDDQRVRSTVPELVEAAVARADLSRHRFGPGQAGHGVEAQNDLAGRAAGGQRSAELALGVNEGAVRHVVDQCDVDRTCLGMCWSGHLSPG